jgi:hypothetical protein
MYDALYTQMQSGGVQDGQDTGASKGAEDEDDNAMDLD